MTTLDMIRTRNTRTRTGSGGAWHLESYQPGTYHLFHHGTDMLAWREDSDGNVVAWEASRGWGSVSDQGGMNKAFKVLGIPAYYSRQGGAAIVPTDPENAATLKNLYA